MLLPEQSTLWKNVRFSRAPVWFTILHYGALAGGLVFILLGNIKWAIFALSFSALEWLKVRFFTHDFRVSHRKNRALREAIKLKEETNVFDALDFEAGLALKRSIRFWTKHHLPYFAYDKLFEELLSFSRAPFVFGRLGLSLADIRKAARDRLKELKKEPDRLSRQEPLERYLWEAAQNALAHGENSVGFEALLSVLADYSNIFSALLLERNLTKEDVEYVAWWGKEVARASEERKRFWTRKNLLRLGTWGENLGAGYTPRLDAVSLDWSAIWERRPWAQFVGHEKEFTMMTRTLARDQNANVVLVGDPGTDRNTLIYRFARQSALGELDAVLNFKRVVELDLVSLIAQTADQGELDARLQSVFTEALEAKNIVLVIDGIHDFVGGENFGGAFDIAPVLAQFLKYSDFRVLATTTFSGLHAMEKNASHIVSSFSIVRVEELSQKETLEILTQHISSLEQKYKVFITYPALRDVVALSARYIQTAPFPQKARDLLGEVLVYASREKAKVVTSSHVANVVSEISHIPVGAVAGEERKKLLNLEESIHQRIINQNEAVKEVSSALMRSRAGVASRRGPIGGFLFMGPTGVGKTETAKALAEIYFGAEEKMVRLDMSEYQNVKDLERLLGSPDQEGTLTGEVRKSPFSLLLLDEIEKAHPNILNVFLQVLDEGHVTDGLGRRVDFSHTIIIATSNAGYQIILDAIAKKEDFSAIRSRILEYVFAEGIFRPEFINRFDAVVIFRPLTREHLVAIAGLMLKKVVERMKKQHITFVVTRELREKIAELGYEPAFGARPMRRVIQDKVENALAKALLAREIQKGDSVTLDPETFEVKRTQQNS